MSNRIQTKNIHGKPRFGDARDAYLIAQMTHDTSVDNPCTSKSLSTMPRRQR